MSSRHAQWLLTSIVALQLAQPGFAEERMQWRAQVSSASEYNTSWLFLDDDQLDSEGFGQTAAISADGLMTAGKYNLTLSGEYSVQYFAPSTVPDPLEQYQIEANLERELEFGRLSLLVRDEERSLLTNTLTAEGPLAVADTFGRQLAQLSLARQWSDRSVVTAFARLQDLDYQDLSPAFERERFRVLSTGLSVRHEASSARSWTLSLLYDTIDSRTRFPVAFGPFLLGTQFDQRTDLVGPALALDQQFGDRLTLSASSSVRRRLTDSEQRSIFGVSTTDSSEWDIFGDVRLRLDLPRGWLEARYARAFRPSENVSAQLADRETAGLSWLRDVRERLSVQIDGLWLVDNFNATDAAVERRRAWQISGRLRWQTTERWTTELRLRHQLQRLGGAATDLDRQVASLVISYRLGRGT